MTVSDILMKQMQMLSELTEAIKEEPYGAEDKAKAVVIISKTMVRISLELRLANRPEPYFSPIEKLEKTEEGLRFGFEPEALQRMADVFDGPDSER